MIIFQTAVLPTYVLALTQSILTGQIRWPRMYWHSVKSWGGTQIQTHCEEETVLWRNIWLEQGVWVARQQVNLPHITTLTYKRSSISQT